MGAAPIMAADPSRYMEIWDPVLGRFRSLIKQDHRHTNWLWMVPLRRELEAEEREAAQRADTWAWGVRIHADRGIADIWKVTTLEPLARALLTVNVRSIGPLAIRRLMKPVVHGDGDLLTDLRFMPAYKYIRAWELYWRGRYAFTVHIL